MIAIPISITVVLCLLWLFWIGLSFASHDARSGGFDLDFGAFFLAIAIALKSLLMLVAVLSTWLIYFAVT